MKLKNTVKEILVEQKWFNMLKDTLVASISPIAASGVLLKNILKTYKSDSIKRIRLIFPESDWEVKAVNFLQKIGVVTGVYESLDDAKNYVQSLVKKGIKADEFVIGSHGKPGLLLMNRSGDYYSFDNSFLNDFKPLLKQNTTVFFTACNGADFLETLKDAADTLGIGVYGSSGMYNYISNSSEKGFYYCSAGEFKKPTTGNMIKPYTIDKKLKEIKFNIESNNKNSSDDESSLTYKIFVKGGSIDDPKFKKLIPKDIEIDAKSDRYGDDTKKTTKSLYGKNLNNGYETYTLTPIHEIMRSLPSNDLLGDMDNYTKVYYALTRAFDSGQIIVSVATANGMVPLSSFKPFGEPADLTNEFLLSSGACKKVSRSPVSWI